MECGSLIIQDGIIYFDNGELVTKDNIELLWITHNNVIDMHGISGDGNSWYREIVKPTKRMIRELRKFCLAHGLISTHVSGGFYNPKDTLWINPGRIVSVQEYRWDGYDRRGLPVHRLVTEAEFESGGRMELGSSTSKIIAESDKLKQEALKWV